MFVVYTPDEIAELITAGSKNKKAASVSQEEKLFASIKHVRLFDEIELTDTLNIISDIKINRYKDGDTLELGEETKGRIYYIISGSLLMPINDDSHAEIGKDQIFGEVSTFTETAIPKSLHISQDNTMIFSFKINNNNLNKESAASFVKLYETLIQYMSKKLLWFEMV